MKVAVVGSGIFGTTTAIHCSRAGHEVHLFDKSDSILSAASGINQFRLHEGYHYPRSPETAKECRDALVSFCAEYSDAIISGGEQYYAIAKEGSRLTGMEYLAFCQKQGLDFEIEAPDWLNTSEVQVAIRAIEGRLDPEALRENIWKKLKGIEVHLNTPAHRGLRSTFDAIIIATYASTNDVALELDCAVEPFQFEVCEKPVVRMPDEFRNAGIVIMDGEFGSLDPFGATDFHVAGHVRHAIHSSAVGLEPEVPQELIPCLDRGIIKEPPVTNFSEFVEAQRPFMAAIERAEHIGSMFTVRAVLPDREDTDERPTLVHQLDEQVIRIFSGKIPCAVAAAESVAAILDRRGETASAAA